jgi:acyl-CoA thioester hydrolase
MREGDPLLVTSLLLDCNDKGIHFLNRIRRDSDGMLAAAVENLELNVDLNLQRVTPFLPEVRARLDSVRAAHAALAARAAISREMALRGKSKLHTEFSL